MYKKYLNLLGVLNEIYDVPLNYAYLTDVAYDRIREGAAAKRYFPEALVSYRTA